MRTKTSRIVLSDPRFITLAALFWTAALILASLTLPASAGAQTTDPLQDAPASFTPTSGTVAAAVTVGPITDTSCTLQVSQDATVVLNDGSGSVTISAANNTFELTSNGQQLTITGEGDAGIEPDPASNLTASSNLTVDSSTGVTCGNGNSSGDKANDGKQANSGDDLLSLSCEELLKRFRAGDDASGQYGDDTTFADPDVRKRVEECLKKEIVQGTAADEKLPDTGGVSLLALAVLGLVSIAACVSVVRGVRRED